MSENNLTGYEKRYNAVYNYLDTHKALKNILLLLYKVLPYVTALSYMFLLYYVPDPNQQSQHLQLL